jgi:hypothetical protein
MSRRISPSTGQYSLLDWTPPEPVITFAPERVKAASLANEMSRVISETLTDCTMPRDQVAQRMSDYLGTPITLNMLDKYASEAAEEHVMNIVRYIAFLIVTGDRRPLQHIAEMIDCIVVPASYRKLIDLARDEEALRLINKRIRRTRHEAKTEGTL